MALSENRRRFSSKQEAFHFRNRPELLVLGPGRDRLALFLGRGHHARSAPRFWLDLQLALPFPPSHRGQRSICLPGRRAYEKPPKGQTRMTFQLNLVLQSILTMLQAGNAYTAPFPKAQVYVALGL